MIVELTQSVTADVVEGEYLRLQPRLWLRDRTLLLGPYHSAQEQEQHFLEEVGYVDWLRFGSDALCFDRKDLLLNSASFRMPETNATLTSSLTRWLDEVAVNGLLRLTEPRGFIFELADVRWMDVDADVLFFLDETVVLMEAGHRLRLRIAQDMDLLFIQQRLCGVALIHPANYLVDSWADSVGHISDGQLKILLHEYLNLVAEPFIQRMEDKDTDILGALVDLHIQLEVGIESMEQQRVIRVAVEDLAERFYGKKLAL